MSTTPNHDWHLDSPESDTIVCSRCAAATYDPAAYFEPCIDRPVERPNTDRQARRISRALDRVIRPFDRQANELERDEDAIRRAAETARAAGLEDQADLFERTADELLLEARTIRLERIIPKCEQAERLLELLDEAGEPRNT